AKLVAMKRRYGCTIEIVPCVQGSRSKKSKCVTVEAIRSGPGDGVDYSSSRFSVFCVVITRDDREFSNSVNARRKSSHAAWSAAGVVDYANSINTVVVQRR